MKLKVRLLSAVQQSLNNLSEHASIVIAYSGGLDSTVLTYLLCQLFSEKQRAGSLTAVHVHHGLQEDAAYFETHTRAQAMLWGLPYQSFQIQVEIQKGDSIEACARKARYACLNSCLGPQDILMLGHHLDDQAETFLLQALRGSGVAGMACMPMIDPVRRYYRPLLHFSKQELKDFAESEGLSWVEDTTNQDSSFDRNFLRNEILPLLVQHFPGAQKTLSRAAQNCADAFHELKSSWAVSLSEALGNNEKFFNLKVLDLAQEAASKLLLKAWLDQLGLLISRVQLDHFWSDVVLARIDASPVFDLGSSVIRRFANQLYCLDKERESLQPYDFSWNGKKALLIPGASSLLTSERLSQQGVNTKVLDWSEVRVHSRRGSERCHPVGREHSQTLKKLFQEYQIPPWERDFWPIVSVGCKVVCVLDLFVCQEFYIELF